MGAGQENGESDTSVEEPRRKLREWSYRCTDALRQEAHEALKKEYDAASKRSRADKVMLEGGIFQQQLADRFLYRFRISASAARSINADQPCILEIHGRRIDGDIHAVLGDSCSIVLSLTEDQGKVLTSIDVIFDLTILIDLVDRRLVMIDKEPERFTVLARPLFTTLDFPPAEAVTLCCEHANRDDIGSLTSEQLEAVGNALRKPFCLIWGPPGTGKTVTLQGVLAELLAAKKRVLFASNTNSAIDNVLERVLRHKQCPYQALAEARDRDRIVRLGGNAQDNVAEQFAPVNIAKRQRQELEAVRERLAGQRQALLQRAEEFRGNLARLKRAEDCLADLARLREETARMPATERLQAEVNDLLRRRADYSEAMDAAGPVAFRVLKRVEAAYKGLRKLHERSSAAGLVLMRKKEDLVGARARHERIAAEHAHLRDSLLARVFRRGRIEMLARREREAARDAEAIESTVASAQAALDAVIQRETKCMTELGATAQSLLEYRQMLQAAGAEAADLPVASQDRVGLTGVTRLLTEDRNLLSAILGEQLTGAVEQLLPCLLARDGDAPDPIGEWFEKAVGDWQAKLQRRRRVEREVADLQAKASLEQRFVNQHCGRRPEWENGLQTALQDAAVLERRIREIQEELEALEANIVAGAQLVAVTMVKASYDEFFEGMRFDALVVDEYSMVSLPQLYCVASLVTERIVLCGDHLQLPPIAVSKSAAAKKWLWRDYYAWHEENEDGEPRGRGPTVLRPFMATLTTQRRMPPEVSELVAPWYSESGNSLDDDWIEDASRQLDRCSHPLLHSRIVILDTTTTNAYSSRSPRGSYHNLLHAGIAGEVYRQLLEDPAVRPDWIRYLTPYRDQAGLARAVLRQLLGEKAEDVLGGAATVHQSQGRGTPIVIYDMTDGVQKKRVTLFHRHEKPNVLNVALTRTQARLILLCSYEKMKRELLRESDAVALSQVLGLLQKAHPPIPVIDAKPYADRVFKSVRVADLLEGHIVRLSEEQRRNILVLRSDTYYRVLAHDLEEAKESILIVAPYITHYRVDRMLPLLQAVVLKSGGDVSIELITRIPEKMFDRRNPDPNKGAVVRRLLDSLVSIGVHVIICPGAHDKLVVIDGRINYWGSLNPLSYRDTRELNTRLEADGLSKQFIAIARSGPSWPYRAAKKREAGVDPGEGLRAIARRELRELRWRIGPAHGRPPLAVLYNKTIETLVTWPPKSWDEYARIPEFSRRNCVVVEHLEELEDIIYPLRGCRLQGRPEAGGARGPLFS